MILLNCKVISLGGGESASNIVWAERSAIYNTKNRGGLGVRDLSMFNKALLGKWMRRLLMEKNSLWFKVVESRYGVCGGGSWA